jgi:hypothetical protein
MRFSGVLAGIIAAGLIMCLDGVDHRPYFRQAYYVETAARLRTCLTNASTIRGEVAAGFGRALLTPTINATEDDPAHGRFRMLPLAGFGNRRGRPATGMHDNLYVKALAIRVGDRVGVMVGADALIIPPEVAEIAIRRLAEEQGLRREQLYLSATHTHCSLGGWGEGKVAQMFAGRFQPGVRIWFADRIVAAVGEAMADLKPAAFGRGSFAAAEFVRNRLVGQLGKVDPEFSFLVVKQDKGRMAVLGSFAAHATVLSGSMMEFSADYPLREQSVVTGR